MKPIKLNLKPSYRLAGALVLASLGACTIVLCMPMSISLKFFICVPVVLVTAFYVAQDALILLPWSFTELTLNAKGELLVTRRDGSDSLARVLPSSFVAAYLTVLNLRVSGSRWQRNMLITADRVDGDAFRRLRVWLRWGNPEQDQNKTSAVSGVSASV